MPAYIDSDLLLNADNLEIILQGEGLPRPTSTWTSDLLLTSDNLDFIIQGEVLTRVGVLASDLLLTSDNLDYLVKGTSRVEPTSAILRQIHSDSSKIYAATSKGLVVFST